MAKVYIVSFRSHDLRRPSKFIVLADSMKSAIKMAWEHGGPDFQSRFDKSSAQAELMKEGAPIVEVTRFQLQQFTAPAERATEPPTDHAQGQGETPRLSWARLLKRVFDIDIEHCPNCGGALKIIACPEPRRRAAIEDPPVIIKILSHLGLPTRAPPRAPARRVDLFQII